MEPIRQADIREKSGTWCQAGSPHGSLRVQAPTTCNSRHSLKPDQVPWRNAEDERRRNVGNRKQIITANAPRIESRAGMSVSRNKA